MTDELDLRLSAAFRSLDLPAADPRLADTLKALRAGALEGRPIGVSQGNRPSRMALLALAASIVVAVAVAASLLRIPSIGPAPSPTPVPTPSATPAPRPTPNETGWIGYTVATLLAARAAGEVGDEQVLVVGWWSDLRPDVACGTPSPSPLLIACGDGQFGLTDSEGPIGTWDGETFVPTDDPAFTPFLPAGLPTPGLGRSLLGLRDAEGNPHPPVFTTAVGHFDDPRAGNCPAEAREACRDRFVIDEIIWAEASNPVPTQDPSATAPAADAPPPASFPDLVEQCSVPRVPVEDGDKTSLEIESGGWVPFADLVAQPDSLALMEELAPEWVYVAVTEPDVPLGERRPDPAGSDRTFRYMGQAVCIGWNGMSGMFHSTVPGTTYELWSDGERVPLDQFPPRPSPGA